MKYIEEGRKMKDKIIVKGARVHNLKNVSLEIPRDKLIVFTGLSGSGKSSLAFDTLYAEGQRRYVESLSAYARQFLGQMISLMLTILKVYHQQYQQIKKQLAKSKIYSGDNYWVYVT